MVKKAGQQFLELVKNTYRVLLTRGVKGCYVCFVDRETERFFKSRMDVRPDIRHSAGAVAETSVKYGGLGT